MIRRRFRPPVRADGEGFVVDVGPDEAAVIRRMLGELRGLLTDVDPADGSQRLLRRLFPVVHPDDAEAEAEYQRLMRSELIASKTSAFDTVDESLSGGGRLDEAGLVAFMQSVNSIRLVLGTALDVSDDPDDGLDPETERSPESHLYDYLSWLLEWSVRAAGDR